MFKKIYLLILIFQIFIQKAFQTLGAYLQCCQNECLGDRRPKFFEAFSENT